MNDLLEKPLYGVAIYNPRLLSKDELVRFFVARQAELGRLVDALRREAEAQPQHHLVVGARGMGKTTLLHRLRYAIADDEYLSSRCLGLVFPEEQYNVGCLADFWLNCVDALADELESMRRFELVEGLDSEVAWIQALPGQDDRGRRALELLCQLSDRLNRRLVLLVDNMDLVLDRLESEQWTLREVLSSEARIQLVGATSAPLESHYQHDKAFYDFFRVHHLVGLGDEETFTVLRRLAEATGHDRVARLLDEDPARVKTVRLMAGGNPRTVVLLFSLLAQEAEGDVRTDIERLLDLCTPLYKHRLEVLSMQAQQVLDALAMHWAPAPAAAIAKATHLKVNVVSAQLDRLVTDGTVEKVSLPGTKRHGFQITERFFNIWCLMRASRRVRQRLVWLVEFLRLMFGPEELTHRARQNEDLEEAANAAKRATAAGDKTPFNNMLATILVARGNWNEAEPWARRFIGSEDDDFLIHTWFDILRFFAEAVRHGFVREARGLLASVGVAERWEPLDRALEIIENGDPDVLGCLSPEMREAVLLVLAKISPETIGDHT
jgi:DNA-binding MarR family transcriptional regulator/GTPase SAR1 family protein